MIIIIARNTLAQIIKPTTTSGCWLILSILTNRQRGVDELYNVDREIQRLTEAGTARLAGCLCGFAAREISKENNKTQNHY